MNRIIGWVVLALTLLFSQGVSHGQERPGSLKEGNVFAKNLCFAKGGIGIIIKGIYVVLKSDKNELLLGSEKKDKWVGQDASKREIVIYFRNKIWRPQQLPDDFDLSEAIIISFEVDKVRFFDFSELDGGYYNRPRGKE